MRDRFRPAQVDVLVVGARALQRGPFRHAEEPRREGHPLHGLTFGSVLVFLAAHMHGFVGKDAEREDLGTVGFCGMREVVHQPLAMRVLEHDLAGLEVGVAGRAVVAVEESVEDRIAVDLRKTVFGQQVGLGGQEALEIPQAQRRVEEQHCQHRKDCYIGDEDRRAVLRAVESFLDLGGPPELTPDQPATEERSKEPGHVGPVSPRGDCCGRLKRCPA